MRSFFVAAFTAAGLALASTSVSAAPIAPIGKATTAVDARAPIYYYGGYYYHRHHHYYHRHCWWRHGYRVCRRWY